MKKRIGTRLYDTAASIEVAEAPAGRPSKNEYKHTLYKKPKGDFFMVIHSPKPEFIPLSNEEAEKFCSRHASPENYSFYFASSDRRRIISVSLPESMIQVIKARSSAAGITTSAQIENSIAFETEIARSREIAYSYNEVWEIISDVRFSKTLNWFLEMDGDYNLFCDGWANACTDLEFYIEDHYDEDTKFSRYELCRAIYCARESSIEKIMQDMSLDHPLYYLGYRGFYFEIEKALGTDYLNEVVYGKGEKLFDENLQSKG